MLDICITFFSMGEEKPDTLDFVKDFQEYLSQQTQHVNMISGSVSGVKEADELPAGNIYIYMFTSPLCEFTSLVPFDSDYFQVNRWQMHF